MRKIVVVLGFLFYTIAVWWAMPYPPLKPEYRLVGVDSALPPLEIGEFDLFGERALPAHPVPLPAQTFRALLQAANIDTLLDSATLASLREAFGEPLEYSSGGILYTPEQLPICFQMKYPTKVTFTILDQDVIQIDLEQPGYSNRTGLQVGSSYEDVYRCVGEPDEIRRSSRKWQFWPPRFGRDVLQPGIMEGNEHGVSYRPKNEDMLISLGDERVTHITLWGQIRERRPDEQSYTPPAPFRDNSRSLGYYWSNGPECRKHLEELGIALKAYAANSKGAQFPPLSKWPGRFAFETDTLYPAHIKNIEVFSCPGNNEEGSAQSAELDVPDYHYFAYSLFDEREGMAFLATYHDHVSGQKDFETELPLPDRAVAGTRGQLVRLREGVERFYVREIGNSEAAIRAAGLVPVVIELPGHHTVPGGHVLYLDGHVDWLPYPGPFPMTRAFVEGVDAVERRLLNQSSIH